jgi:hypothetical protein
MNTRLMLLVCAAAAFLPSTSTAQASRDTAKPGGGAAVSMRGCVSGSLLKSVQADAAAGGGTASMSDRYRMTGSKTVRGEIKKANKKYVAVTGRVQAGPQATMKETKVGGTTIGIGVTQGTSSGATMPYTPTLEVDSVSILADTCGN